jgi:hypothetical protein
MIRKFSRVKLLNLYLVLTLISWWVYLALSSENLSITKYSFETNHSVAFYSSISRFWEFGIGGILSLISAHSKSCKKGMTGILLIAILFLATPIIIFGMGEIKFTVMAAFLSAAVIRFRVLDAAPFRFYFLRWLGDRSYSIYLWHLPIMALGDYLNRDFNTPQILSKILGIFVTFVAADISFRYLEPNPSYGTRHRKQISRTRIKLFISSSSILILITYPLSTIESKQFPNDSPSIVKVNQDGCVFDTESGPPCQTKKSWNLKSKILLIGDSHAGALANAVLEAGKESDFEVIIWTHSGCPLTIQSSVENSTKAERAVCNSNFIKTLSWIKENKPEVILVATRINSRNQIKDLEFALKILKRFNSRIIVFQQTPTFPKLGQYFNYKSIAISNHTFIGSFDLKLMNDSLQIKNESDEIVRHLKLPIIKTWEIFCDSSSCTRFNGINWLYTDDNHLSEAGGRLIVPTIIKMLKSQ